MNEQEMRKKVLDGLTCCDALHNGGVVKCGTECPYGIADGIDRGCRGKLIPDALALINEMDITIRALMGEFGDSCDVDSHCGGGTDG